MENAAKIYALVESAANGKFIAGLEAGGARVVRLPPVEIERLAPDEKSAALCKNLTAFDWIIFADVFAAEFFLDALEAEGRDLYELDELRICALGEAVADRLRFAQVHADIVPNSVEPKAVIASLAAYIGEGEIGARKFLIIKRQSPSPELEGALKETGASFETLEIYRRSVSDDARRGDGARLKALVAGGAIDEFVFASPADFFAFEEFFGAASEEILRGANVSASDSVTVQFLRDRFIKAALFRRK